MTKNLHTHFTSPIGKLTVYMRFTKAGNINVGSTLRQPDAKAVSLPTSTYHADDVPSGELASQEKMTPQQAAERLAAKRFDYLCMEALNKGWTRKQPRIKKVRAPKRVVLAEIPAVPAPETVNDMARRLTNADAAN
jgi:hypothetical protein